MPQPASAEGPWGEAIRYWLNVRRVRQADLVKGTGLRANTVSRATRGFHTTTRVLEKIAAALNAPFDAVLVSPERKLANEERKQLALEISERVLRQIEERPARHGVIPAHADTMTDQQLAEAVVGEKLTAKKQAKKKTKK